MKMDTSKTSTFTIHHDRCDPSKWTPNDILALAKFIQTGDMSYAAHLSRRGMQLVLSEHHEPKGGSLQEVGFAEPEIPDGVTDDLQDLCDDDITQIVRVYSGPIEYAVQFAIGDEEGNVEGHEIEIFNTEAEAQAFVNSMREAA